MLVFQYTSTLSIKRFFTFLMDQIEILKNRTEGLFIQFRHSSSKIKFVRTSSSNIFLIVVTFLYSIVLKLIVSYHIQGKLCPSQTLLSLCNLSPLFFFIFPLSSFVYFWSHLLEKVARSSYITIRIDTTDFTK